MYKYLLIIIIFFAACTPQQRLNRLYKKHPELFSKDTMVIYDTTYLAMVKTDTVFKQSMVKDTMVIQKDRLTMKYFYSNDTVYLSGECKDTTIIKEVRVEVDKANIENKLALKWYWYFIIGFILMLIGGIGTLFLRR